MGIDLHVHSNASDGEYSPRTVVARAAAASLDTIALTDHDTIEGCREATATGSELGVRVISGCEFSVAVPWGEVHLLAYFLPVENARLMEFIETQQEMRSRRATAIISRLAELGITINLEDVLSKTSGHAVGRPHVARALVEHGAARNISDAFHKFLGTKRPAFVPKQLPDMSEVAALVRSLGGITSAAHLKSRATRATLTGLKAAGVDAVEVVHPAHVDVFANKISSLALKIGLLRTGGSDWHGDSSAEEEGEALGAVSVPEEWLEEIEQKHQDRLTELN